MADMLFASSPSGFLESPEGKSQLEAQTMGRFNDVIATPIPWIGKHTSLASSDIIEIGCGAGASTAAFAAFARSIHGYDIDEPGINAARERMRILGIENCTLTLAEPRELLARAAADHPDGADIVLCYAVLEHQTLTERIDTLRRCWALLKDGGLLVVADTPNRLTYSDHHTSFLPFFHMLPHELALAYAHKSPREGFWASLEPSITKGEAEATEHLIRWGRGVSYHEFELALGNLNDLVVGDGFDPEMLAIKSITLEERLLYTYMTARNVRIPPAFCRESIDVILRKGGRTANEPITQRTLPIQPLA
jgi:2-polyprenyl-3-methyl-5-hydroxy-6-metoxy-1,4-benzoquinol methylase